MQKGTHATEKDSPQSRGESGEHRYTTEGGWYDCDRDSLSSGHPEVIGGWVRNFCPEYLGICRSLWSWVTLGGTTLTGVGTDEKFYVEQGGSYYDITPIQNAVTLSNPFTATAGLSTLNVHQVANGKQAGDCVTFYSALLGLAAQ